MMKVLLEDLAAKAEVMYSATSRNYLIRAAAADGGTAIILFRGARMFADLGMAPIAWFLTTLNRMLNGVTIGLRADIAPGFVLQHSVGVVINGKAVIGPHCVLEGGVVIGSVRRENPVLEAGVYIGSGAKIIGGVVVGEDSRIGANAVVVKDVPRGSTVVGVPGRVV